MEVILHRKQRVLVSSNIRFQHSADSGRKHEVELNERQFRNLNDVIKNLDYYNSVHYFPLGGGAWLHRNSAVVEIIDNRAHSFFWFYQKAWYFYITSAHTELYDFIRKRKAYHHQSDAKHESRPCHSLRGSTSNLSYRHKTLSRSPRNDHHEDEKRSQRTNFSRSKGTDSRSRVRCRRGKNATRIHHDIKDDQHIATSTSSSMHALISIYNII